MAVRIGGAVFRNRFSASKVPKKYDCSNINSDLVFYASNLGKLFGLVLLTVICLACIFGRLHPYAQRMIESELFKLFYEHEFVVFSAYTYHAATRVDKRMVSIVYASTSTAFPFVCEAVNDTGWRQRAQTEHYYGQLYAPQCAMMSFVARCYLPPADHYFLKAQPIFHQLSRVKDTFQLRTRPAYNKREALVVCTSPSYLYELWATAIVSIESARHFGATLRVVYIQSILADLLAILRAYEKEGILLIKPGFDVPILEGAVGEESSHHNQAVAINDCLNQFKDAADFIVVADWDDIFLSGFTSNLGAGTITPAYNSNMSSLDFLKQQTQMQPSAGAFVLEWMKAVQHAPSNTTDFSICSTVAGQTAEVSTLVSEGKYMMIPSRVKSAWVHYPIEMEYGYTTKKYEEFCGTIFCHLNKPVWREPSLDANVSCEPSQLDHNFRSVVTKYGIENEFLHLPRRSVFFEQYQVCFNYGTHLLRAEGRYFCPSYTKCDLTPQQEHLYVISNAHYLQHSRRSHAQNVFIYMGGVYHTSLNGQRQYFKQRITEVA